MTRKCRRPMTKGTVLEAVTKDQLNTGLKGQIRYKVCENNLYAYLFGVNHPIAHVMGYFVSVLRERIANFEAPPPKPGRNRGQAGAVDRRRSASRSTICARTSATSTITWPAECASSEARVRNHAGCVADHRDRSAAGGRVGAGGDQHGVQPGLLRHQPGPGVGGPENRAIQTRGGDRNA